MIIFLYNVIFVLLNIYIKINSTKFEEKNISQAKGVVALTHHRRVVAAASSLPCLNQRRRSVARSRKDRARQKDGGSAVSPTVPTALLGLCELAPAKMLSNISNVLRAGVQKNVSSHH